MPKPAEMAPAEPMREPRGARRKRETRARLLEAALELMAERGVEGVAINEITEAADVGFGSFYNHFKSKEAIYDALIDTVFEEFGDTLDRLAEGIGDPAEYISICIRHAIRRAGHEPVWGRFLVRQGLSGQMLSRGLGPRLQRDIRRGLDAGRFTADDPVLTFIAVGGTVLTAISAQLQSDNAAVAEQLGADGARGSLDERTVAVVMRLLGLPAAEAETVARCPLPAA
ncbi:TetR/AcrR family transcriptional regulator [Oleomonas cavernae]|uniref:TetR/AcrR family transcriptional regulator n=1 Tax=Oleomonas cavernae TaxID=2320859 RepID=A0A418WT66_9PROT|nr:TetR/AcrR family transcriptional regulator [Oleomonas cavernae]RJF94428.1 TetR/AcrR family transcriptional regulator [Oleomonas cavernae]